MQHFFNSLMEGIVEISRVELYQLNGLGYSIYRAST